MPHMQHIDELIREYFLFRGFTNALKWFDFDVKLEKDKGFRVSDIILLFVNTNDAAQNIMYLLQLVIRQYL